MSFWCSIPSLIYQQLKSALPLSSIRHIHRFDSLIVPLTSRTATLLPGEFILTHWVAAGLNVPSAVKRGIYTVHPSLIVRLVGQLSVLDAQQLEQSVRGWLGL